MSRFKRFVHALASGYMLVGANAVYTFISIPLALYYLTRVEFGLWALASQVAGYIALVDFGMSGAAARILIDYKDDREGGQYGSLVMTTMAVNFCQGAIILVCGAAFSLFLGPLLRIPSDQMQTFMLLIVGLSVLQAVNFCFRTFNGVLWAHQRYDINNYGNILNFVVSLPVMWIAFAHHGGVYSLLWSQTVGTVSLNLFIAVFAYVLGCMPHRGEWGRPAWHHFRELFGLGRDVFLMSLGSLLVNATQTMVITRVLGLETSAVWTVCTRVFNMALMLLYRIYDFSFGALAEMFTRGEKARFLLRFRSLVILSGSLAVWGGVLFALCNQPFVQIWTHGKVTWPRVNDLLLGIWLVVQVIAHCHVG